MTVNGRRQQGKTRTLSIRTLCLSRCRKGKTGSARDELAELSSLGIGQSVHASRVCLLAVAAPAAGLAYRHKVHAEALGVLHSGEFNSEIGTRGLSVARPLDKASRSISSWPSAAVAVTTVTVGGAAASRVTRVAMGAVAATAATLVGPVVVIVVVVVLVLVVVGVGVGVGVVGAGTSAVVVAVVVVGAIAVAIASAVAVAVAVAGVAVAVVVAMSVPLGESCSKSWLLGKMHRDQVVSGRICLLRRLDALLRSVGKRLWVEALPCIDGAAELEHRAKCEEVSLDIVDEAKHVHRKELVVPETREEIRVPLGKEEELAGGSPDLGTVEVGDKWRPEETEICTCVDDGFLLDFPSQVNLGCLPVNLASCFTNQLLADNSFTS